MKNLIWIATLLSAISSACVIPTYDVDEPEGQSTHQLVEPCSAGAFALVEHSEYNHQGQPHSYPDIPAEAFESSEEDDDFVHIIELSEGGNDGHQHRIRVTNEDFDYLKETGNLTLETYTGTKNKRHTHWVEYQCYEIN